MSLQKIIAKLERWNKEHSVANQQKIAAAQAKMQAEEEAQKVKAMEVGAVLEQPIQTRTYPSLSVC